MTRTDDALARKLEAIELLHKIAPLTTDPGARGYTEGSAQRLESRPGETVDDAYLGRLRLELYRLERGCLPCGDDRPTYVTHPCRAYCASCEAIATGRMTGEALDREAAEANPDSRFIYTVLRGMDVRSVHADRPAAAAALRNELVANMGWLPDGALADETLDRAERNPRSQIRAAGDINVCAADSDDLDPDAKAALDVLTELTGEWVTTAHVANVAGFATPGAMGDDGRGPALRALRRLEAAGKIERRDLPNRNYHWRYPEPDVRAEMRESAERLEARARARGASLEIDSDVAEAIGRDS